MRMVSTDASAAPSFAPMKPDDQQTTNAADIAKVTHRAGIPICEVCMDATLPIGVVFVM